VEYYFYDFYFRSLNRLRPGGQHLGDDRVPVVQAVGACAGVVLARAMVPDLYEGDPAAQMMSTLLTVMAIAPLLGPILGGQILALVGCT
jgi:MFS family permease